MVARRTGLSVHVIRVWEQRYGAVAPERSATKRRLYSASEVERLTLLRQLTAAGHTISTVANLTVDKLRELAAKDAPKAPDWAPADDTTETVRACIAAVRRLDAVALQAEFHRASVSHGVLGSLQHVVAPIATRLGELWRAGGITVAQEHCATAAIRQFLDQVGRPFAGSENSPVLVVATPAGQLHELGALLASATATQLGWRVIYLGASLPATEIAGAALQQSARAVALSLVYPEDDPNVLRELRLLRQLLSPTVALIAGGRAAPAYRGALDEIAAVTVGDLGELGNALDEFRWLPKQQTR